MSATLNDFLALALAFGTVVVAIWAWRKRRQELQADRDANKGAAVDPLSSGGKGEER